MLSCLLGYAWIHPPAPALLDLQCDVLHQAGCTELVVEQLPVGQPRPGRAQLLQRLRPGDTLVVWKLDRLANSLPKLVQLVLALYERHLTLRSLADHLDTGTTEGPLLFPLLATLAARLSPAAQTLVQTVQALHQQPGWSATTISRHLGVSRATVYRYLARAAAAAQKLPDE